MDARRGWALECPVDTVRVCPVFSRIPMVGVDAELPVLDALEEASLDEFLPILLHCGGAVPAGELAALSHDGDGGEGAECQLHG